MKLSGRMWMRRHGWRSKPGLVCPMHRRVMIPVPGKVAVECGFCGNYIGQEGFDVLWPKKEDME